MASISYKDPTSGAWVEIPTGGTGITVDSTLSSTSENPVQNKVVTISLNDKASLSGANTFAGNNTFSKVITTKSIEADGNINIYSINGLSVNDKRKPSVSSYFMCNRILSQPDENHTYEYNFPTASGTFALTSDAKKYMHTIFITFTSGNIVVFKFLSNSETEISSHVALSNLVSSNILPIIYGIYVTGSFEKGYFVYIDSTTAVWSDAQQTKINLIVAYVNPSTSEFVENGDGAGETVDSISDTVFEI